MNFKLCSLYDADGDLTERWFLFFYFQNPQTGKWKRFKTYIGEKYVTRISRYQRAQELKTKINQKLQRGYNPFVIHDKQQTATETCLKKFIETRSFYLRPRTMISYRSYVRNFSNWLEMKKLLYLPVEEFTSSHAQEFMDYYSSTRHPKGRTWNNNLQALKTCFTFLVEKEYIPSSPFLKIKKLPKEEPEIIAYTTDELEIIRTQLPAYDPNLRIISLLIFTCFLRPQEIVRLQVRHLKGVNGKLYVPGSISKNKKNETIAIPPQLQNELRNMNLDFPGDYYVFGKNLQRSAVPIAATRIAEAWRKFARKVGLEKNIYALKHTGNGLAIQNGANARDLQLQNRHSSLEETQKYLDRFCREPSQTFVNRLPTL